MGYVRIYVFAGCLFGFLVYRLTLGALFSRVYVPIIAFIKKLTNKIVQKLKNFTKKLLKNACNILYNISNRSRLIKNKLTDKSNNKRVIVNDEK